MISSVEYVSVAKLVLAFCSWSHCIARSYCLYVLVLCSLFISEMAFCVSC